VLCPLVAIVTLAACASAAVGGRTPDDRAPRYLLYVCNQEEATVSVIDMSSNTVVETIDLQALGFSANAKPHHIVAEADGSFWYVTLIGDGKIVKLDGENRVVASANFETPGLLALHPTKDLLFVGRSMSAVNPPPRIGVIRRPDMSIDEVDVFFPRPHALVVAPGGDYVYSASMAQNRLASFQVEMEALELIDVDGPTHSFMQFAVSPDGRTLVASGEVSGKVLLFDLDDPARPSLRASLDVGAAPWDPAFTPDGRFVYVGNQLADQITVIDVPAARVVDVIEGEGLGMPHGSVVSPDGRWVYVSNRHLRPTTSGMGHAGHAEGGADRNGTVVVVDTETRTITKVIQVGRGPSGIGMRVVR
jgi:YVTN family beta-propeller protein